MKLLLLNERIVIDFDSEKYDDDIRFIYEHKTEVLGSCTATLKDEHFVIGGNYEKRQVRQRKCYLK